MSKRKWWLAGGFLLASVFAGTAAADEAYPGDPEALSCSTPDGSGGTISCYWKPGANTASCYNLSDTLCRLAGGTLHTGQNGPHCDLPIAQKPC